MKKVLDKAGYNGWMTKDRLYEISKDMQILEWYMLSETYEQFKNEHGYLELLVNGTPMIPLLRISVMKLPTDSSKRALLLGYTYHSEGLFYKE